MDTIRHFIKGIVVGATMMVPGVSGGTMALILGIYDDIISAMSNIFEDFKKNAPFLFVVGMGGLIGLVLISWIVDFFIKTYTYPTMFLFLGIVLGGLPILFKEANKGEKSKYDLLWFIIGIITILILLLLDTKINKSLFTFTTLSTGMFIYLFIAGIIVAVALILPGISTSFLLLTLGLLEPTIEAIKNFDLLYLTPIALGTLFGIFATTKILESLMNNKTRPTYLMIIGFVVASMFEVFPGVPNNLNNLIISLIMVLVGYKFIIYITERFED